MFSPPNGARKLSCIFLFVCFDSLCITQKLQAIYCLFTPLWELVLELTGEASRKIYLKSSFQKQITLLSFCSDMGKLP